MTEAKCRRVRTVDATILLMALLVEGRQAGVVLRRMGHEPAALRRLLVAAAAA